MQKPESSGNNGDSHPIQPTRLPLKLDGKNNTPIEILLIEDNPEEAQFIQDLLGVSTKFACRITHAGSLAQGIELAGLLKNKRGAFHLALLDLNLPDSRGYDTFHGFFQANPHLPIILLTGTDDETLAMRALQEGAQDYLVKTEIGGALLIRAIRYAIKRFQAEEALLESQERYALAVMGANDGLWDWDLKSNRIYFSPRWKSMLGYAENEMGEDPEEWMKRIHPEDRPKVRSALSSHLKGASQHLECEYRILHKDGSYRWMLARGLAVEDKGNPNRMAGSQTDITIRKRTEAQIQHDAFHDALTGLPNRALFLDRVGRSIERLRRHPEQGFAVLLLDIDRFKLINDSLGHASGDIVLGMYALKLTSLVRSVDSVARIGGDDFAVLLDDLQDIQEASQTASRLHQALQEIIELDGRKISVNASIGIAPGNASYERPEDALSDAEIAMYQAKIKGRGQTAIFHPAMRQEYVNRLEMENDLRMALENSEFEVHYQPIVSLKTWKITGFEALLRWHHPMRGLIPPKEFIPVAEETGLIHALGIWVLRQACQQMRLWHILYPSVPPLSIHVNFSGKQFTQLNLVEKVQNVLQETGLDANSLQIELTESLFVENDELFNTILSQLTNLGVKLQIDDFGTGYSSFSYLQRLPVSSIKIDQSFINRMEDNNPQAKIVNSILHLSRSLGLTAIAEGVETAEQMNRLQDLECKLGQGYYISYPVNSTDAGQLLRKSRGTGQLSKPVAG